MLSSSFIPTSSFLLFILTFTFQVCNAEILLLCSCNNIVHKCRFFGIGKMVKVRIAVCEGRLQLCHRYAWKMYKNFINYFMFYSEQTGRKRDISQKHRMEESLKKERQRLKPLKEED